MYVSVPGVGFMIRMCLSLTSHFVMGIFLFTRCVRVAQLFSGFLSKGIASCVSVDSGVSMEEVSSGTSYVPI